MSYSISPNMQLPIPGVGTEAGPNYATDVNNSLTLVDQHDHSAGRGVQITPAGININSSLNFNSQFVVSLAGATFTAQTVVPVNGTVYQNANDLYFVDALGNNIQITANGAVAGTPGSIANLAAPASASYVSGSSTFVFQSNVSIAANLDAGSLFLRNISPNSTNAIELSAPAGLSSSYTITLPSVPSQLSLVTIDTSGNLGSNIAPDASTIQFNGNVLQVAPGGITPTQVAPGYGFNPSGAIIAFGGASSPTGYLLCDGTSYLQATYPTLFAAIGTAYGSIDGTHFNVPDLRGQFLRGVTGASPSDPDASLRTAQYAGGNIGNNVGSSQGYQIQSHNHTINYGSNYTSPPNNVAIAANFGGAVTFNNPTGGNETRPINVYVNYIIKV